MTEILSSIGSIFTSAIGWAGKVGETVVGTPLLLCSAQSPLSASVSACSSVC